MNKKIKHSLILGAVLTLSFCQGRRSSIIDPTGQNYMSAQQLLSTPLEQRALPGRNQNYSYSFTQQDFLRCQQEYFTLLETGGTFSEFCNQYMYTTRYMNFGQYNGVPDTVAVNYNMLGSVSSAAPYDFPWQEWGSNNPGYVNGLNQAYPGYQPPINMQAVCTDPGSITNMNYNSPCGQMNAYWATYNMQGNQAFYNMAYQGNPAQAQSFYGPSGTMYNQFPTLYTGATGATGYVGTLNRNVEAENQVLEKNVQLTWQNLKATPKNGLMKLEIVGMNIAQSKFDELISNFEARGSAMVAASAAKTGYNQSITNYNYNMANYYYQNSAMAPMSAAMTANAMDPTPESYVPPEQYHWVVGDVSSTGNGYIFN